MKTIYLAGGCFWGTEHYIRQFEGILETVTGYANGNIPDPTYEQVYTDQTGYAECVKVTFDENILDLKTLCKLFFISIDPLQKDGQAGDIGTRYRTGIYWSDEQDKPIIEDAYAEILSTYEADGHSELAVEICPLRCFYPAEDYHQDYLTNHPDGYCHISFATQHFAKEKSVYLLMLMNQLHNAFQPESIDVIESCELFAVYVQDACYDIVRVQRNYDLAL